MKNKQLQINSTPNDDYKFNRNFLYSRRFCKYFTPELKKHQICALGKCTGISIIDSTPLVSCHIKRMHMHKTMKGWAAKGKCTMGWFYGFKLHLIINNMGEIIQWQLTLGNVDDRAPLKDSEFTEKLFGKLFADRG